jgi:adenylate kinase family enzyme
MSKIQFVNAFTQEIIREEEIKDNTLINNFITSFEETKKRNQEVIIFDHGMTAYQAMYLSHSLVKKEQRKVYRVFFRTKVSSIQPTKK